MIGRTLDHYEILEKVGVGGMGEVYRARDVRLDRTVAVKILPPQFSRDRKRRQRFEREAKTISSLQHPNICTLYDVGREDGVDYLVMEFIVGETLAERLRRGPLSLEDTLRYGAEIAHALDRAHRSGIVHRDLKPGNVMVTKMGVKLLDFGLAKFGGAEGRAGPVATQAVTATTPAGSPGGTPAESLTTEGTILGTFQYMAPEQLERGEADARSDIFALGAVLYEMASGRRAFDAQSRASLIAAILEREPVTLSSVAPRTPPALKHVVHKCMEKDPDGRWQSAFDVAGQLLWIAESGAAVGESGVASKRNEVHTRITWAIGTIAVLSIVATALMWWGGRPTSPKVVRFEIDIPDEVEFVRTVSVSPDGRHIAIGTRGASQDRIWLRSLHDLSSRPVPGTEGADLAFWSPDGRQLAFFSDLDGKLRKMGLDGGMTQIICDAPTGDSGTWSSDGVILFDGSFEGPIARVSAGGGTPAAAFPLDSTGVGRTYAWPVFLPDERHFLFLELDSNGSALSWADLETGERARIGPVGSRVAYVDPGYLLHVREETLVAQPFDARRRAFTGEPIPLAENLRVDAWGDATFTVSRDGVLVYRELERDDEHLVWVARDGRVLEEFGDPATYEVVKVASDGRIAVERSPVASSNFDIWVLDPQQGTKSRLTFDPGIERAPLWTSDGRHVIYAAQDGEGGWEIRRRAASGVGDATPLAHFDRPVTPESMTSDGETLIVSTIRGDTGRDILTLDLEGDATPVPFVPTPSFEIDARLSPDDRWIVYVSDESGRLEVYVRSFPDGESKWQVSIGGGQQPSWRGDGKEIYYVSADRRLMAVSVDGRGGLVIGTPEELFALNWLRGGTNEYAPSPDGERFLFIRDAFDNEPTPFTVVLNWDAELGR